MAYQLALKNQIHNPFQNDARGRIWFRDFLKRHPNLSIRTPRATSKARAKGFTQEYVKKFFNVYEDEFEKVKGQPHRIYNVDETGICVVQHKIEDYQCEGKERKNLQSSLLVKEAN